jgi:hypothetical protein
MRSQYKVVAFAFGWPMLFGCAGPDAFTRFTSEEAPCKLPPLTDLQVHDAVVKVGKSFHPDGLPEPNWKVTPLRCVYEYEESAFYMNGKPSGSKDIDGMVSMYVARDSSVFILSIVCTGNPPVRCSLGEVVGAP